MPTKLSVSSSEYEVIQLVKKNGAMTRADLARLTDYSRSKINGCIDALVEKEYLKGIGSGASNGGRRPRKFDINGGYGFVAGVEIGATSIELLLADLAGKTYARYDEAANVREGPEVILDRVCSLLHKMMAEHGASPAFLFGMGLGVPGPVDFASGVVVSPPIMPGWDAYPIRGLIEKRFPSVNVVVDNDVNVMARGELYGGAGTGIEDLIFVKIGTGIGCGIVCDGKIYRGSNGCAGDIGHICVDKNGPLCRCGNVGCLEAMAAGPIIAERAVKAALDGDSPILLKHYENNGKRLRAENVGYAASEGDTISIEIIRDSGRMIGEVLASLVNFYNPSMILIGGGISNIGNLLLSSIRQATLRRSLPLATRDLRIIFSPMGSDAGVVGAMALAIDSVFVVTKDDQN